MVALSFLVFCFISLMLFCILNRLRRAVQNGVFVFNTAGMEVLLCICALSCSWAWALTNAFLYVASPQQLAPIGDILPLLLTLSLSFSLLSVANLAFAWLELNQQASSVSQTRAWSCFQRLPLVISVSLYVILTFLLLMFRKYSMVGMLGLIYFIAFNLMYYFVGKRFTNYLGGLHSNERTTRAMKRAKRVIVNVHCNFLVYIPCLAFATAITTIGGIRGIYLLWLYKVAIDMIILCLANFGYLAGLYGSAFFEDRVKSLSVRCQTASGTKTKNTPCSTKTKKSRVEVEELLSSNKCTTQNSDQKTTS